VVSQSSTSSHGSGRVAGLTDARTHWLRIDKWLYGCGELTEINDCRTTLVPWMPIDHAPRYVTLL
jgi:hypothetical protein